MAGGLISNVLLGCLAIALLYAAYTDFRRREIDNWLTGGIALAAPLFWFSTGLDLWPGMAWQVGIALLAFAVAVGLFALGAMGGGDVKLIGALALWIAPLWFMRLLVMMSLVGLVVTIAFAAAHRLRRREGRPEIPYGIAISAAGLWTLASQHLHLMQGAGT